MERIKTVETLNYDELTEHKQRIAFHEAGHAAGICLNNKAKQLPPVYFKIIFKGISSASAMAEGMAYQAAHCECWAYVEGGRLIECLPLSIDSIANNVFNRQETMAQLINDYMLSFEADITNLLIGPLAEAKHVAEMDDELFNHKLVNLRKL